MRLLVEEEYGYKYWHWTVDGTEEQIRETFEKATSDEQYYAERDNLGGHWEECRTRAGGDEYDGFAHIHNNDDSTIRFCETDLP
tara:strand:+ start:47 stop:298 length:252 start_codon:yes stop_codon:yes gene_type:complete